MIRQHQFHKVELVKITTPEQSDAEHEKLTQDARRLLEKLKLPYRVMRLCGGDISFSANHCYDLEVWLPGQQAYRENFFLLKLCRFSSSKNEVAIPTHRRKKPQFCHTINGSGLAVGRTLVAILENYQNSDGSVDIPEVLQPYMGGLQKSPNKKNCEIFVKVTCFCFFGTEYINHAVAWPSGLRQRS